MHEFCSRTLDSHDYSTIFGVLYETYARWIHSWTKSSILWMRCKYMVHVFFICLNKNTNYQSLKFWWIYYSTTDNFCHCFIRTVVWWLIAIMTMNMFASWIIFTGMIWMRWTYRNNSTSNYSTVKLWNQSYLIFVVVFFVNLYCHVLDFLMVDV